MSKKSIRFYKDHEVRVIWQLLSQAMTDKINDRETFTKGIDYSYYYEQSD